MSLALSLSLKHTLFGSYTFPSIHHFLCPSHQLRVLLKDTFTRHHRGLFRRQLITKATNNAEAQPVSPVPPLSFKSQTWI